MRSTWCCSRSAPLQLLYGEPVDENDRSDQNRSAGICACAYPDLAITRRVEVHFANIFSIAHARGVGTSCARFGRLDLGAICRNRAADVTWLGTRIVCRHLNWRCNRIVASFSWSSWAAAFFFLAPARRPPHPPGGGF